MKICFFGDWFINGFKYQYTKSEHKKVINSAVLDIIVYLEAIHVWILDLFIQLMGVIGSEGYLLFWIIGKLPHLLFAVMHELCLAFAALILYLRIS